MNCMAEYVVMLLFRIMPSSEGGNNSSSVEHFVPKSIAPKLAYEWSNYRLASRKANTDRGDKYVLDPFEVDDEWFVLDLFSGVLSANPSLECVLKEKVEQTIGNLKLNSRYWKNIRIRHFERFNKDFTEAGGNTEEQKKAELQLKTNAPIVWKAWMKLGH